MAAKIRSETTALDDIINGLNTKKTDADLRSWRLLSRSLRECQKEVSVQKAFKVLETLRECQKEVSVQKAFKVLETLESKSP